MWSRTLEWLTDPDVSPMRGALRTSLVLGGGMAVLTAVIIVIGLVVG